MRASLQQQKLNLVERILAMQDAKQIKAVWAYVEALSQEENTLSADLEEELRLGDEDVAAGRVVDWEVARTSILEAIKVAGAEYTLLSRGCTS
jgi:hypothetical protein